MATDQWVNIQDAKTHLSALHPFHGGYAFQA